MPDEEQAWFEAIQGIAWFRLNDYARAMLSGSRGSTQWHAIYIEFIAYHLAMIGAPKKIVREQVLAHWVTDPFLKRSIYEVVEQQYAKHNVATGLSVARAVMPAITTLTPSAQKVYTFLFQNGKAAYKNAYAVQELSYGDITAGAALAINTVRRALEELEDQGYAVLVSKGGPVKGAKKGEGVMKKSSYRLLTPKERQA